MNRQYTVLITLLVLEDAQENLILCRPAATVVHFGEDVSLHELDMDEGAFLLSATYAQQLLTLPAPPKPEIETTGSTGTETSEQPGGYSVETASRIIVKEPALITEPASPVSKPVAPGRGGRHYRLRLKAKPEDFFYVMQA